MSFCTRECGPQHSLCMLRVSCLIVWEIYFTWIDPILGLLSGTETMLTFLDGPRFREPGPTVRPDVEQRHADSTCSCHTGFGTGKQAENVLLSVSVRIVLPLTAIEHMCLFSNSRTVVVVHPWLVWSLQILKSTQVTSVQCLFDEVFVPMFSIWLGADFRGVKYHESKYICNSRLQKVTNFFKNSWQEWWYTSRHILGDNFSLNIIGFTNQGRMTPWITIFFTHSHSRDRQRPPAHLVLACGLPRSGSSQN